VKKKIPGIDFQREKEGISVVAHLCRRHICFIRNEGIQLFLGFTIFFVVVVLFAVTMISMSII